MLTRVRKNLLKNNSVTILKSKIEVIISILNLNKQVVIVQENATRYIIN